MNKVYFFLCLICFAWLPCEFAAGQKDSVYRAGLDGGNKLVRGRVVKSSVFEVTVETSNGEEKVPAREIKKISYAGEPRSLGRARDQFENGRFNDCLESLRKITDPPNSKFMQQEIKFLECFATGNKALRGDPGVSTANAEQLLSNFVKSNSDSFRLVMAIDLYARLLMANGKTVDAQREFNKLTKSQWPKYVARGHFFEGETLVHENKLNQAQRSFQQLAKLNAADEESQQYRLLGDCQLAKITALNGNPERAISAVEQIIQNESAENVRLFAYAYNALGTCYLQTKELKKACRAFLHTELLFSSESDAHAEALFQLAQIWPQLNETSRANRARELLNTRYRNTIWAAKL